MIRGRAFLLVVALLSSACGVIGRSPEEEQRIGIEATMRGRVDAVQRKDLNAYLATMDPSRAPLRRCDRQGFEEAARGRSSDRPTGRVTRVEPLSAPYVRAYVEFRGVSGSPWYVRWYFRKEADRWLKTEPALDELGGERTRTVGGQDVAYWGIDEDVVDLAAAAAATSRELAGRELRPTTTAPFKLTLYPTRESLERGVPQACGFVGQYEAKTLSMRMLLLQFDPSLSRFSSETVHTFQHETMHWVQHQNAGDWDWFVAWWLVEGYPEHVIQDASYTLRKTDCDLPVPTMRQLIEGPTVLISREPDTPTEMVGLYYKYARSFVDYVVEKYGRDAYWRLFDAHKGLKFGMSTSVLLAVYENAVGVSADRLYADWAEWSKARYC